MVFPVVAEATSRSMQRRFAQCISQKAADQLTAVHADNGINAGIVRVILSHCLTGLLGNQAVIFDTGHIYIIINMRMVRRKMAGDDAQGQVFVFAALNLNASVFHGINPFQIRWEYWNYFLVLL